MIKGTNNISEQIYVLNILQKTYIHERLRKTGINEIQARTINYVFKIGRASCRERVS